MIVPGTIDLGKGPELSEDPSPCADEPCILDGGGLGYGVLNELRELVKLGRRDGGDRILIVEGDVILAVSVVGEVKSLCNREQLPAGVRVRDLEVSTVRDDVVVLEDLPTRTCPDSGVPELYVLSGVSVFDVIRLDP